MVAGVGKDVKKSQLHIHYISSELLGTHGYGAELRHGMAMILSGRSVSDTDIVSRR